MYFQQGAAAIIALPLFFALLAPSVATDDGCGENQGTTTSKHTKLGSARILTSELVEVGDIDRNGVPDYIWRTERENGSRGAIRVFLMESAEHVLSSHHIAEEKWGFTAKLQPGDRFGSAVTPVGDVNGDGVLDLAVGASGDSEYGHGAGAVYILLMSCDGAVREYKKIAASDEPSLSRQHRKFEGFGSAIETLSDLNGDGVTELSVSSSDGSKTLVALEKTGKSLGAIKFSKGVEPKDIDRPKILSQVRVLPLSHLVQPNTEATGEAQ